MRFEPAVDRSDLLKAVQEAYGLPARTLTFLPVGFAACYLLYTDDGARSFLKLWPELRVGQPAAARQYATLVLTHALHEQGLGVRVPYPLPVRNGALWADLSGMPFALFPLLRGSPAPDPWPPALCEQVGRAMAALHRATPVLAALAPVREQLDIAYEAELRRNLEAAEQIGPRARPGLRAVRRWAQRRRDAIQAQLARLHQFQAAARRQAGPIVLCHTDLHFNNLLVEEGEPIGILDWDDAKLAPPEHDLWAGLGKGYRGRDFAPFLAAYRRAGGAAPLYLDQFAFYLLRRYLEDMTIYLGRLVREDADEREDERLLHLMEDGCVELWSRLDATLAIIGDALEQYG